MMERMSDVLCTMLVTRTMNLIKLSQSDSNSDIMIDYLIKMSHSNRLHTRNLGYSFIFKPIAIHLLHTCACGKVKIER